MQYLRPVGFGPSSKTCPKWAPHWNKKYTIIKDGSFLQGSQTSKKNTNMYVIYLSSL